MAIRGGFCGKLLEVDLTRGAVSQVGLPSEEVLRLLGGGTGLGLYLLAGEIRPGMKVTDPEAPSLLLTGPLTGTMVPSASTWTIVNLRLIPDYCIGVSHAHGWFGARLKHAGWDGIIFRGISPTPVYLWIDDDQVELRDAAPYWGLDSFETPKKVATDHGDPQNISVACIGPAGENVLPGSTVRCDGTYSCSMGDAGVGWGVKRLKCIAVRGHGRVPLANPDAFAEHANHWREALYKREIKPPDSHTRFRKIATYGEFGGVPVMNFTRPEDGEIWCRSLREDGPKWKVKPVGSWNCEMACHHATIVTTGALPGSYASGFGSEVFEEVGPNMGIMDAGTSMALSGMVDALGFDGSEVPRTIAALMEAYNAGRISRERLDGVDLTWGNHEAVIELLYKAVRREGIGAIMAKGLRECGRELDIEDLMVHMRGVGFQGHDYRARPGSLFARLIGGGGGGQEVSGLLWYRPGMREGAPDLGYERPIPPDTEQGIGKVVFRSQAFKLWQDTVGGCKYAMEGVNGLLGGFGTGAVEAAVGWAPMSKDEALTIGERVNTLQRLLMLYRGYEPESDFDISARMLSIPSGPAKEVALPLGPYLARWRDEYYTEAGWDTRTGVPTSETLSRLDLSNIVVGKE